MQHSESIAQIAAALAKAQGQMPPLVKDRRGQIGKSPTTYADLASMINVMREPFAANGLAYSQSVSTAKNDNGVTTVTVTTMLLHESGEWMRSDISGDAEPATGYVSALQQAGRATTYLRRYALGAAAGIAAENDDDGATTQEAHDDRQAPRQAPPQPHPAFDPDAHPLAPSLKGLAGSDRNAVKQMLNLHPDAGLRAILTAYETKGDGEKEAIRQFVALKAPKVEAAPPADAPPVPNEDPTPSRPDFDENGEVDRDPPGSED